MSDNQKFRLNKEKYFPKPFNSESRVEVKQIAEVAGIPAQVNAWTRSALIEPEMDDVFGKRIVIKSQYRV